MPSPLNRTITLTKREQRRAVSPLPLKGPIPDGAYCDTVERALEGLPSNHFDLIIADPPYNYGVDFGNNSDKRSEADYREWTMNWISKLPRVATANASIYICCAWEYSSLYQEALEGCGLHVLNRITWKREKGRGAKRNWKQNMEDIWFAVRDKKSYTFNLEEVKVRKKVIAPYRENGKPKDWNVDASGEAFRMTHPSNIWTDLTVPFWSMPENTPHPTQKPEALMERIILASSNRSEER